MARKTASILGNILKKDWADARKDVGTTKSAFSLIPADKYVLKDLALTKKETDKDGGNVWINRKGKVASGPYKGKTVMDSMNFSDKGIKWTMIFFNLCGYTEIETEEDIDDAINAINESDNLYDVKVSIYNDSKYNVNFNDIISADEYDPADDEVVDENVVAEGDEPAEEPVEEVTEDKFADMDEDALFDYIEDNKITYTQLGFGSKAKMNRASEEDLRESLAELEGTDKEPTDEPGEDPKEEKLTLSEVNKMNAEEVASYFEDNELDVPKGLSNYRKIRRGTDKAARGYLCDELGLKKLEANKTGTPDKKVLMECADLLKSFRKDPKVTTKDSADTAWKKIKKTIKPLGFPASNLDEKETKILTKLGFSEHIQKED